MQPQMQPISHRGHSGSEGQSQRQRGRGSHRVHRSYAAQRVLAPQRQLSPHRLLVVVHRPEGVQLRGEGLAHSHSSSLSSSQRVTQRQRVTHRLGISPAVTLPRTVIESISLISEGCRRIRSGAFVLSLLRSGFQRSESSMLTVGSSLGSRWRSTTPNVSWASGSARTRDYTGVLSECQQGESLYSRSLRRTLDCVR
jgi:hypothetical protein